MHEIKIYGEIVPFEEDWIINQGGYVNLTTVQRQLAEADGKDVTVKIRSFGGDVETGFTIYNELRRYARDNKAKITTLGEGQVASIATVIFLAGDERILTEHTEPFVHNAWTYEMGDAKTFNRIAVELEKCNVKIAKHYALHTDLTEEEALSLMENETSITVEEAVSMRFAHRQEEVLRPVALKRFSTNTNNKKMNKKTQTLYNKVAKFLGQFSNKVVTTADGKELDFYELEDDAVIAVGDKAYFDGMDADGSFIMPSGETYVFVAGELQEIQSEDETDTNESALAEANATIALLTEQLESVSNKAIELDTQNKAKDALIAGYKASSKPAPNASKPAPTPAVPAVEPSKASLAVANLKKHLTKQ